MIVCMCACVPEYVCILYVCMCVHVCACVLHPCVLLVCIPLVTESFQLAKVPPAKSPGWDKTVGWQLFGWQIVGGKSRVANRLML